MTEGEDFTGSSGTFHKGNTLVAVYDWPLHLVVWAVSPPLAIYGRSVYSEERTIGMYHNN
jgi:hypothetical protein